MLPGSNQKALSSSTDDRWGTSRCTKRDTKIAVSEGLHPLKDVVHRGPRFIDHSVTHIRLHQWLLNGPVWARLCLS